MYRFEIVARTQTGESIALVGSTPELGLWEIAKCVPLRTSGECYPLWWTDTEIDLQPPSQSAEQHRAEYKYLLLSADGRVKWEALGMNRWVPIDPEARFKTIVVDDGAFGYLQPEPFGYIQESVAEISPNQSCSGLKIAVIGSSVALGYKAWRLKGWSWLLAQTLQQKYGHQLVNVSELGANVTRTIERFALAIGPEKPDVVIIALSLGNEGLAYCAPHERRAVQRRFESGLQQVVKMTRELGAYPILGAVYPHGDYGPEHHWLLWDTHKRMMSWGVPILDWLAALDNGRGRWKQGISFDPSHPNTLGHRLMYEAIDLNLFEIDKDQLAKERRRYQQQNGVSVYFDRVGFEISAWLEEKRLRLVNRSSYNYTIAPYWQEVQTALQEKARLLPGIYIAQNAQSGIVPYFAVGENGSIETIVNIPADTDLEYSAAFNLFAPNNSQLLFYDGHLGILRPDDRLLRVINETDLEYNIHPMWQEVHSVLKAMPEGVYEDPLHPDVPFRTMMIGKDGLESRVKVPPKSSVLFQYKCQLSAIRRVAIVPLGARCAVRMLLYKLGYDGPAFPFDLTRTTNLGDVADMIANGFQDMWNPDFLHYNDVEKRIYHSKWSGLSFAHEVEDTDDPIHNMHPIYERMYVRYQARSQRFWYTLDRSDKLLFVRNGFADRVSAIDLLDKLAAKCQDKPFCLLLISPQPSEEYADLPNTIHYNLDFNPDRMYADVEHWLYCAEIMRGILDSLGVSSKNLFWCPPTTPQLVG